MLFLVSSFSIFAQDLQSVYKIVDGYPRLSSVSDVAMRIKSDFSTDEEKAGAIYRWVATNIAYNTVLGESMSAGNATAFSYSGTSDLKEKEAKWKIALVQETLKNRSAICHGYAVLTESIARMAGLQCEVIMGTLKSDPSEIGNQNLPLNHAWNSIKVNGDWKLVDTTLGAGFISAKSDQFEFHYNEGYLFISADLLALSHYSKESRWRKNGITEKIFADHPVYFGHYFANKFGISTQSTGLHSVSAYPGLRLRIEKLTEDDYVQYVLSGTNKFVHIDDPMNTYIEIPVKEHSGEYLSIFVNSNIMCVYKMVN